MSAILFSPLENGLKFVLSIGIAWARIVCGGKFRDSRDAENAGTSIEKK